MNRFTCLCLMGMVLMTLPVNLAPAQEAAGPDVRLHALMPPGVLLGVAVERNYFDGREPDALALLTRHFNSITAENLLKWHCVQPKPGDFRFDNADAYVSFGLEQGMTVIGHTLVWPHFTPKWVFEDDQGQPLGRDALLERLRTHIHTVVGRYRGRIRGWDVVNEAFLDDTATHRDTPWFKVVGPEYIPLAFQWAHEADPDAELYYNDFYLWKSAKRDAVVQLVRDLKARGLRIDAVGEQAHWSLKRPTRQEIARTIDELHAAGVKVMITELDITVLPFTRTLKPGQPGYDEELRRTDLYPEQLPDDVQAQLAQRYAEIFRLVVEHRDKLGRVTFWNLCDRHSWLNDFPLKGRHDHPLLWDRQGRPKPAFDAVVGTLRQQQQQQQQQQ